MEGTFSAAGKELFTPQEKTVKNQSLTFKAQTVFSTFFVNWESVSLFLFVAKGKS